MAGTVSVRMYNVGFGDAFVVTVTRGGATWRLLLDCGVHSQGQARPISESVAAIIADLRAESPDGVPRLDVVAATHRHADHISGFALDAWDEVEVGEVWLPFVADDTDPDAAALRHPETALRLLGLVERRTEGLNASNWPRALSAAKAFALNSFGNADSMDRLLSRNGLHFATTPPVRFLPDRALPDAPLELPAIGARVHVVGPSRDPEMLKQMNPPSHVGWWELDLDAPPDAAASEGSRPLFDPRFVVADPDTLPHDLDVAWRALALSKLTNDAGLLTAASVLERAVNNTSLFFVLDVAGTRLVFPGDAQHGAWEHVLGSATAAPLLRDAAFYKIGHHGSHNATPKRFVEEVWHDGGHAMLPFGLVKRWADTIPKLELLEALAAHGHTVTRADQPHEVPGAVTVQGDLWSQVTLETA